MVLPHGQEGGVEPVRTFFGKEEKGQFFAILCGRFYGRPLPSAYNFTVLFCNFFQLTRKKLVLLVNCLLNQNLKNRRSISMITVREK